MFEIYDDEMDESHDVVLMLTSTAVIALYNLKARTVTTLILLNRLINDIIKF